ncbi:MAG: hypothetical protein WA081_21615 [Desulfosalsimonadaceae bacterium]
MNIEYGPSEEFLESVIKIQNDQVYQNEVLPAECFVDTFEEFRDLELIRNIYDPPDFFIQDIHGKRICLEVTSLGTSFTFEHNSFIRFVENIVTKHVESNLKLLPKGVYGFFFVPSSLALVEARIGKIQIADFTHKVNKKWIDEFLYSRMEQFLSDYANTGKKDLFVLNKKGEQIGVISLTKLGDSKITEHLIFSQQYVRLADWTERDISQALQTVVSGKELKYQQSDIQENLRNMPWWLLISDIHETMGTANATVDFSKIRLIYNFFDKVFLISQALVGQRVIQL